VKRRPKGATALRLGGNNPFGYGRGMVTLGYFLSSEERDPREMVDAAARAEQAGFTTAWISDHYHPWTEAQGQSAFVWSTIGAIANATSELKLWTAVTCPTIRIHPAVIAQASATSAVLSEGRFGLGVGSGEALNEHIFGDPWPDADTRLEMLEEAVDILRRLFTGEQVSHRGTHYRVENARLYTVPDTPPEIYVSGFGPKAVEVAARIGDGYMNVGPEAELLEQYRRAGGKGRSHGGMKVAWAASEDEGIDNAHRIWPNDALPGELPQVLPTPAHFEQASQLVTREMIAEAVPAGPDPEKHLARIQQYVDAGYDEVYVAHIGPDQAGMIDFYAREIIPNLPG
jgi:G6PDH family F420-dependent oxidoreductase